ncbi:hypothetical protein MHYP_G00027950 [Metynnis hypsauchen]
MILVTDAFVFPLRPQISPLEKTAHQVPISKVKASNFCSLLSLLQFMRSLDFMATDHVLAILLILQMWAGTQVRMSRDLESGAQVQHPQQRARNSTRMKKGHQRKRDGDRAFNGGGQTGKDQAVGMAIRTPTSEISSGPREGGVMGGYPRVP